MEVIDAKKYLPSYYSDQQIIDITKDLYTLSNMILDDKELCKEIKKGG